MLEIRSLDELHRDEQMAVNLAEIVNRDDVRMLERSRCLRFAEESLAESRVLRDALAHHLDGDGTIEHRVHGAIDDAHGAFSDLRDDLVFPDACYWIRQCVRPKIVPAISARHMVTQPDRNQGPHPPFIRMDIGP